MMQSIVLRNDCQAVDAGILDADSFVADRMKSNENWKSVTPPINSSHLSLFLNRKTSEGILL